MTQYIQLAYLAQVQAVFVYMYSLLHLVPMECLCSYMFLGAKWNLGMVWPFKQSMKKVKHDGPAFGILVVGETGIGKSTLISNLLGQNIMQESDGCTSTSAYDVIQYSAVSEGVPFSIYATAGFRGIDYDDRHFQTVKAVLDKGYIHLVIYCLKLMEIRMRSSLIHSFQEYHKMGVKWEHTVIALTFADSVPVSSKQRNTPGFNMASFFNDRVTNLGPRITTMLVKRMGVAPEVAKKVKYYPTTFDRDEMLPNGEQWFVPFLLGILEMLSPGATMQQSNCMGISSAENVTSDSTALPLAKRGDNQTPVSPTPTLQDHSTLANGECGSVHGKCVLCLELD